MIFDDFPEDSPDRHAFVDRELARLPKAARKEKPKTDMTKHDAYWNLTPGCTLGYAIKIEAGDDARGVGNDD